LFAGAAYAAWKQMLGPAAARTAAAPDMHVIKA